MKGNLLLALVGGKKKAASEPPESSGDISDTDDSASKDEYAKALLQAVASKDASALKEALQGFIDCEDE